MLGYLCYFIPLLWAARECFNDASWLRRLLAAFSVATTWFYILRFTFGYTGNNLILDSYVEVSAPFYWGVTSQLLAWAVVAMIWSHETKGTQYQLLGVFGAMSASFILWDPPERLRPSSEGVPVHYTVSGLAGLYCIHQLKWAALLVQPDGSGADAFEYYLTILHLLLLVPKGLSWVSYLHHTRISSSLCYALMLVAVTLVHWEALTGLSSEDRLLGVPGLANPVTDCQFSIGLDLVFCTGITLISLVQYYQPARSFLGSCCLFGWLPAMLVLSPAGVLVAHMLTRHAPIDHACLVGRLQRMVAQQLSLADQESEEDGHGWVNLGYWKGTTEYIVACRQLAEKLGDSLQLAAQDRVLSVGCGSGQELDLYKRKYDCARLTGVEVSGDAVYRFVPSANVRMVRMGQRARFEESLRSVLVSCSVVDEKSRRQGDFDKIVALDNVYHQPCRASFFRDCAEMLSPGGSVGVTDLVLASPNPPFWVKPLLWLMNVGTPWTKQQYIAELHRAGLSEVSCFESLEPHVMSAFAQQHGNPFGSLVKGLLSHLDYAVVVAGRPGPAVSGSNKPKVAVIGSGMAGCVCAYRLAHDFEVTLHESRDTVGLSGHKMKMGNQIVDIPLRMMGECYYPRLTALLKQVQLPVIGANTDTCFFDEDGVALLQPRSSVEALFVYLTHLKDALQFAWAVLWRGKSGGSALETFGAWAERCCPASLLGSDLYRIYVKRQLSWMFSCTYEAVDQYPADVVLEYIRCINPLVVWRNRVVRVTPSIHRLQCALVHDAKVLLGQAVSGVGSGNTINGVAYDHVIFATEASAVCRILKDDPRWQSSIQDVFGQVKFHPSRIVVHTDASLMPSGTGPSSRRTWKALNVHSGKDGMSSLTVWLNSYYDSTSITTDGVDQKDVFQTWNPHQEPSEGSVLKEVHFLRVKHTSATKGLQAEIQRLQGIDETYFCGSYSAVGVGLLEQAVVSAENVARLIRKQYD